MGRTARYYEEEIVRENTGSKEPRILDVNDELQTYG